MKKKLSFQDDLAAIIALVKRDTVRIPPPPGKPVHGCCEIPRKCISPDGEVINRYTTVRFNGENIGRHVLAAGILHGELPPPWFELLHQCDRKACVAFGHLRVGTAKENATEASERALLHKPKASDMPRGERSARAQLTDLQASYVRWLIENQHAWFTNEH